ncbi:MAG: AgmX/PglI C-terminal domain-containing protein [Myxococcales bacterium]
MSAKGDPGAGKTGGQWLYKRHDLLVGPVSFEQLIELLYAGDIDASTPISPHGGSPSFEELGKHDAFQIHLAKAQAKLRVEAQHEQQKRSERRRGLAKIVAAGFIVLALVFAGGRLAAWLAIHRPWADRIQHPEPMITDELPVITLASEREDEEEELAYPGAIAPGKKPSSGAIAARPPRAPKQPASSAPAPGRAPRAADPDADGLASVQMWDQAAINRVVKAKKATLHRCLAAEATRQRAGWSARVPIEFTIGNNGRVTKLWIDSPDFRSEASELYRCMLEELRQWRFPAYEGEQANVSLTFQIQAR